MLEAQPVNRTWRDWIRLIPARGADYFLLFYLALDLALILFHDSYRDLLPKGSVTYVRYFDFSLIAIWSIDFILRLRRQEDRWGYVRAHWYEAIGLFPLHPMRYLLALRAAKIGIAYFRILRSDRDVGQLVVEEITFRFRDIFVDTIADAVFLRSLERVDEVMSRLDYETLARSTFQKHQASMQKAVHDSINSKSIIGDLARIPLMGTVVNKIGADVSSIVIEVLETEVTGRIMKDITSSILTEMNERVKLLDLERLTGRRLTTGRTKK